jgi:hypothetical protein
MNDVGPLHRLRLYFITGGRADVDFCSDCCDIAECIAASPNEPYATIHLSADLQRVVRLGTPAGAAS